MTKTSLRFVFYYGDRVPVLFSNVMITVPADDERKMYSFPADRIGEPGTAQMSKSYGAGLTYFWSLKNVNAIPNEPYTYTFDDLTLMTAFVVNHRSNNFLRVTDWEYIAENYFKDFVEEGSVKRTRVEELGFPEASPQVSFRLTDSFYTSPRRALVLRSRNSLYPLTDGIDNVFTKKSGDASDLAYIFYKVLRDRKADVRVSWIRDKRQGTYEPSVASLYWFDRIGVLVRVGNEWKIYDFDRSVPARYEVPTYLKSITVPLPAEKGCEHRTLPVFGGPGSSVHESHDLAFKTAEELHDYCATHAAEHSLVDADTVITSAILDDPEIRPAFTGKSKASVAPVEAFLTVKLPNETVRGFREEVFSAVRYNDFVLTDPLTMSVSWRVHVPPGYVLRTAHSNTTICQVQGLAAVLKCTSLDDGMRMQADLVFSENVIPADNFPRLIKVCDGLLSSGEQAIVLAKK